MAVPVMHYPLAFGRHPEPVRSEPSLATREAAQPGRLVTYSACVSCASVTREEGIEMSADASSQVTSHGHAHPHIHRTQRSGWLRAGVLGANDGVLSVASLILGVAAARSGETGVFVAGIAGLVAGALSMGAGEYVSVSSQADTERADLEVERLALARDFENERDELTGIYIRRGVAPDLASKVAEQLMAHDALGAHARDEIGISDALSARPLQAAVTSALSFAFGGVIPLVTLLAAPERLQIPLVGAVSLAFLASLGAVAARAGGASIVTGATRVLVWGALAMALTAGIGTIFGAIL